MLWDAIRKLSACEPLMVPEPYRELLLFRTPDGDSCWLIGEYRKMTPLATALRDNEALRDFLSAQQVRLGLRSTDLPPADVERRPRYGGRVRGKNFAKDFTFARGNSAPAPVRAQNAEMVNRKTDREQNVKNFWDTQTPQSHHIVEFNNLETLGQSNATGDREMDYGRLPTVLLAAEFHQRYFSIFLKPSQHWSKTKLQSGIADVYRSLYQARSKLFEPLWEISKVILSEAGIKTT